MSPSGGVASLPNSAILLAGGLSPEQQNQDILTALREREFAANQATAAVNAPYEHADQLARIMYNYASAANMMNQAGDAGWEWDATNYAFVNAKLGQVRPQPGLPSRFRGTQTSIHVIPGTNQYYTFDPETYQISTGTLPGINDPRLSDKQNQAVDNFAQAQAAVNVQAVNRIRAENYGLSVSVDKMVRGEELSLSDAESKAALNAYQKARQEVLNDPNDPVATQFKNANTMLVNAGLEPWKQSFEIPRSTGKAPQSDIEAKIKAVAAETERLYRAEHPNPTKEEIAREVTKQTQKVYEFYGVK